MSEPFNLDAVASDVESFRFTFKGESFELPSLVALPFDVAIRYTHAQESEALQLLMGDEQWERFVALEPTLAHVRALAEQWWGFQGAAAPESLASKRS